MVKGPLIDKDVDIGAQVGFDPLDGSSIVGANFAVGSIFGVWPGSELVGRKGREQAAAAYAVYGPRTVLVIALAAQDKGAMADEMLGNIIHLPESVHHQHDHTRLGYTQASAMYFTQL